MIEKAIPAPSRSTCCWSSPQSRGIHRCRWQKYYPAQGPQFGCGGFALTIPASRAREGLGTNHGPGEKAGSARFRQKKKKKIQKKKIEVPPYLSPRSSRKIVGLQAARDKRPSDQQPRASSHAVFHHHSRKHRFSSDEQRGLARNGEKKFRSSPPLSPTVYGCPFRPFTAKWSFRNTKANSRAPDTIARGTHFRTGPVSAARLSQASPTSTSQP